MGNALRLVVTMVVPAAVASAIPAIVMAAAAMMPMPVTMAVPDLNYRVVLRGERRHSESRRGGRCGRKDRNCDGRGDDQDPLHGFLPFEIAALRTHQPL